MATMKKPTLAAAAKKMEQHHKKAALHHAEAAKHAKWIQGAIRHPGALHKELGVKAGEKIPAKKLAAAAKKPGVEGKRARLAETLKGFKK